MEKRSQWLKCMCYVVMLMVLLMIGMGLTLSGISYTPMGAILIETETETPELLHDSVVYAVEGAVVINGISEPNASIFLKVEGECQVYCPSPPDENGYSYLDRADETGHFTIYTYLLQAPEDEVELAISANGEGCGYTYSEPAYITVIWKERIYNKVYVNRDDKAKIFVNGIEQLRPENSDDSVEQMLFREGDQVELKAVIIDKDYRFGSWWQRNAEDNPLESTNNPFVFSMPNHNLNMDITLTKKRQAVEVVVGDDVIDFDWGAETVIDLTKYPDDAPVVSIETFISDWGTWPETWQLEDIETVENDGALRDYVKSQWRDPDDEYMWERPFSWTVPEGRTVYDVEEEYGKPLTIGAIRDKTDGDSITIMGCHGTYGEVETSIELLLNAPPKIVHNYIGHVLGEETITVSDAIAVLRHIVGLVILEEDEMARASVTGNENLSVSDAIYLLRYIVGLISEFPVTEL